MTRFPLLLLATSLFFISCQPDSSHTEKSGTDTIPGRAWWKEAVVYQIYPRSFKDDDGDGVGDLKGIITKLDYIKSLGIDAVWLNPVYSSPNFDNGYDVSDYYKILEQFGTMSDFEALLKGLHERKIKLVMDVVVNHSSSEHEWFRQSRSSRTNPFRNYYHWWNAEKGKPTPRYSFFDVNNDAWKFDSLTQSYYLHYFSQQQPDLNWENPALRQEIYKMMKFWLDKGVDGFRMDAFQFVAKDTSFPAFPPGYERQIAKYYGAGPHLHDYIQEMNQQVFGKYDIMTVAEGAGSSPEDAMKFVDPARNEFNIAYHFEGIDYGHFDPDYPLPGFKKVYSEWDSSFEEKGWLAIFLANHDQPRMVTHWGNDAPAFRALSSKMLTTFIMTMRGTPYYYYGDELGMSNIRFDSIQEYQDISTRNMYQHLKNTGGDLVKFMEGQKLSARDNGRTPFQWDSSYAAGFTKGHPWLKVNPNYKEVNAASEEKDSASVLNYFRRIVKLRKENLVMVYGKYFLLDKENPNVYAYLRELGDKKFLVLLNFKSSPASLESVKLSLHELNVEDFANGKVLIDNYGNGFQGNILRPYEAAVIDLSSSK